MLSFQGIPRFIPNTRKGIPNLSHQQENWGTLSSTGPLAHFPRASVKVTPPEKTEAGGDYAQPSLDVTSDSYMGAQALHRSDPVLELESRKAILLLICLWSKEIWQCYLCAQIQEAWQHYFKQRQYYFGLVVCCGHISQKLGSTPPKRNSTFDLLLQDVFRNNDVWLCWVCLF